MEELGLEVVGEEEHVQDLADAVLPGDRLERHVVVEGVVREVAEHLFHVTPRPGGEEAADDGLGVGHGAPLAQRPTPWRVC